MVPDLHKYFYGAWVTVVIVWIVGAFDTKRSVRRQSPRSRFLQVGAALLIWWLFARGTRYFPWLAARVVPLSPGAVWAGLFITYLGIGFVIAARFYLGRNWSGTVTIKEDHKLIRGGPYAVVRHPIYSGFPLAGLGTTLANGQIRGLLAVGLALTVMLQKIGLEEAFMTEKFGEEYLRYKQDVKELIPFVW
jgi:protein-S-isoprenylcysteine O-methyltransferase Ste14